MVSASMIRFTLLLAFFLALPNTFAQTRVALVRVSDIYREMPETTALQASIKAEREEIIKSGRAEQFRQLLDELQAMQAEIKEKSGQLDEATLRSMARAFEIKRQEAQSLQAEFEQFRNDRNKDIDRKMVKAMRASLDRIHQVASRIAAERGYDLLLDPSGNSNTGLPVLLYSKQADDITELVSAALKDEEGKSPAPEAPAAPVGATPPSAEGGASNTSP